MFTQNVLPFIFTLALSDRIEIRENEWIPLISCVDVFAETHKVNCVEGWIFLELSATKILNFIILNKNYITCQMICVCNNGTILIMTNTYFLPLTHEWIASFFLLRWYEFDCSTNCVSQNFITWIIEWYYLICTQWKCIENSAKLQRTITSIVDSNPIFGISRIYPNKTGFSVVVFLGRMQ